MENPTIAISEWISENNENNQEKIQRILILNNLYPYITIDSAIDINANFYIRSYGCHFKNILSCYEYSKITEGWGRFVDTDLKLENTYLNL